MSFFKSIDWSKVLSYGYHIGLLAGSIAVQTYAPHSAQVWVPLMQALGQASPTPEGISLMSGGK